MRIYQADCYCDSCGKDIEARLAKDGKAPQDPTDESSYDSDDYPKYASNDEESDSPTHCASGEDCLEGDTLPSGRVVGCLLGGLTGDGARYVADAIRQDAKKPQGSRSEVVALWAEHFGDYEAVTKAVKATSPQEGEE